MPLYKNTVTGLEAVLPEDYTRMFPDGTFELVSKEAPSEKRERERLEAQEKKVDVDTDEEASMKIVHKKGGK